MPMKSLLPSIHPKWKWWIIMNLVACVFSMQTHERSPRRSPSSMLSYYLHHKMKTHMFISSS
eukprot:c47889_g1_i1 orf=72-257(-)